MAYLGNNNLPFDPTRTAAQPRDAERFSGNGSTTNFTLSRTPPNGAIDVTVYVENVAQEPIVAYDVVGTSLIFTEAPPTGTYNIYVVYRNTTGAQVIMPDGSVSYNKLANNLKLFTTDNYTGNGACASYGLSEQPADANTVMVTVDGVMQRAPIHYTVSGSTITFTENIPASANISIRHLGFRTAQAVTAVSANSFITTPTLSSPIITLAQEGSSFKGNVTLYDSTGASAVATLGAASSGLVRLTSAANTVNVTANTISFANTALFSVANTTGAIGLSLDSASRLAKAYQPSFSVSYTGNALADGTEIIWGVTTSAGRHNIGGHYNPANGRFTAPIAGRYQFDVQVHHSSGAGTPSTHHYFDVCINGTMASRFIGTWTVDNWYDQHHSIILDLAKNEYVSIFVVQAQTQWLGSSRPDHNRFSGYFLG